MLTVETIGRVRREFHVKGKKIKAIARELRVSRNTAHRARRRDGASLRTPGAAAAAAGSICNGARG
jgi:orotate phosphoribosyltransferase-like protein